MAWYYWLWIGTSIAWFLDFYSSMIRLTKQNGFADLVAKPILAAFLAAIWPVVLVWLIWKFDTKKPVAPQ